MSETREEIEARRDKAIADYLAARTARAKADADLCQAAEDRYQAINDLKAYHAAFIAKNTKKEKADA